LIQLKYHLMADSTGQAAHSRQAGRGRGWLRRIAAAFAKPGRGKISDISISLVVPCYNVEHYIDEFIATLIAQTSGLSALQVILVDDGSTDGTPQKAMDWASRHPGIIEYHRQSNAGLAGARNAGLQRATGDWVSFPDPDDMLAPDYLKRVRNHIRAQGEQETAIVACKIVLFHEQTGVTSDDHVLTYRFKNGTTVQTISQLSFVQLQVATAFYRREKIAEWGLQFDTQLKPGFEDALFANQYLIRSDPERRAVFAADAVYIYRKRASSDSMQDLASTRPEFWTSQPRGWLALLEDAQRQLGSIPPFVGRVVLYNMKGHLRILLDPSQSAGLAPQLQAEFEAILDQVIDRLGEATIRRGAPAFRHRLQLGLLNRYGLGPMPEPVVYLGNWHEEDRMVEIEWFSSSRVTDLSAMRNEAETERLESTAEDVQLLGRTFYYHHRARLRVDGEVGIVDADGKPARLRSPGGGKDLRTITASQLRESVSQALSDAK
jgi:GT2 family glycosyltransferase